MSAPKHPATKSMWFSFYGLLVFIPIWMGYGTFSTNIPQQGRPAELYSTETRDDLQLTFSNAIRSANDSILLIIYSINDHKVINALKHMAQKGCDVTIICDAIASKNIVNRVGPLVKVVLRKGKGLMHQKILVIDGKKVWIGSANMTTASLKYHSNLVAGFDSPDLANMITARAESMSSPGRISHVPPQEFNIGGQSVEMWFLPNAVQGPEKVRKLIQTAKKTLKIAMFTWARLDFAQEICAAHKRGVHVEVVIDQNSASGSSAKVASTLRSAGIPFRTNQGNTLLHHKFMIVDDKILVNGSANWTLSAFTKNDDCFVVLNNLTQAQAKHLNSLWQTILQDSLRPSYLLKNTGN